VISVKGSITTSVDSAIIKTTQSAVSNFVPVVGKFVSDSLESIMGATEVIGKTAGVIGIIVMIVVTIVPIIQMIVIFVSHKVLAALTETITDNKNTISIIDSFAETYKVLLGVLIGILALFIMSSGVLIKLMGSIS
jgi:stage III sporulation protein AE